MSEYVNCQNCINKQCNRYGGPYGYTFCEKYIPDAQKPKTNGDCLRSMNDEELEDQLVLEIEGMSPCKMFIAIPTGQMFISREAAKESVGKWLKQPVEREQK